MKRFIFYFFISLPALASMVVVPLIAFWPHIIDANEGLRFFMWGLMGLSVLWFVIFGVLGSPKVRGIFWHVTFLTVLMEMLFLSMSIYIGMFAFVTYPIYLALMWQRAYLTDL